MSYTDEEATQLAIDSTKFSEEVVMPTIKRLLAERFPNRDDAEQVLATIAGDIIVDAIRTNPQNLGPIVELVKQSIAVGQLAVVLNRASA